MKKINASFFSQSLNRRKHVTVLAPENNEAPFERLAVLYLLHGYGGNKSSWINNTNINKLLNQYPLIIVCPESGRRWFINDVNGYQYEEYLIKELIPFVEREYPVQTGRQARGIGGFSMGGAAAIFQALRHPSLFSLAFSHSGAFEAPLREDDPYAAHRNDPELLMPTIEMHERVWGPPGSKVRETYNPYKIIASWSSGNKIKIYFDQGLDDFDRMIAMNRNFHIALKEQNVPHTYREVPGKHDWDYINANLPFSLEFAYAHLQPGT